MRLRGNATKGRLVAGVTVLALVAASRGLG